VSHDRRLPLMFEIVAGKIHDDVGEEGSITRSAQQEAHLASIRCARPKGDVRN